jgi:hypothetical protein
MTYDGKSESLDQATLLLYERGCALVGGGLIHSKGRVHSRRLCPFGAARPALVGRAAHAVESAKS